MARTQKKKETKREEHASLQGISKEIRRAVETGKVSFGTKQGEKILLGGKAELIIISTNCQKTTRERITHLSGITQIPILEFRGTGLELGSVCGKPFTVSVMVIQKAGKSKILSAAQ